MRFAGYLVDGIETDEEYSDIFGYRIKFPKKLFTLSNAKQKYIENNNNDSKAATKGLKSLSPPSKDLDPSLLYRDIVSKSGSGSGSGSNDNATSPNSNTMTITTTGNITTTSPRSGTALDLIPMNPTMKQRESITNVSEANANHGHLSTSFGFESALKLQQSSAGSESNDIDEDVVNPSSMSLPKPLALKKTITLSDILNGNATLPSQSLTRSRYSQSERVDAGHNPNQPSHSGLTAPHGLQLCMSYVCGLSFLIFSFLWRSLDNMSLFIIHVS